METNEKWKPIEGWEERYEVSSNGNVRSLNYRSTGGPGALKPLKGKKGYLSVGLCRDGKMKWAKVHRLVATAFIPNPDNKPQVNHINGDKSDNRAVNLEWATDSENIRHEYNTGLKRGDAKWGSILGKKYGEATRSQQAMKCRRAIVATNIHTGEETVYESAAEVERALGICHASVPRVCRGKQKTAKGYSFRYAKEDNDEEE